MIPQCIDELYSIACHDISKLQTQCASEKTRADKAEVALKNALEVSAKYEDRYFAEQQLRQKAEAACAEVVELVKLWRARRISRNELRGCVDRAIEHALSSSCGVGWLFPEVREKVRTLLTEIIQLHADPNAPEYNECDKQQCYWCEQAKEILALLDSQSSDCGKGWLSPEVRKKVREALTGAIKCIEQDFRDLLAAELKEALTLLEPK